MSRFSKLVFLYGNGKIKTHYPKNYETVLDLGLFIVTTKLYKLNLVFLWFRAKSNTLFEGTQL